MEAPMEQVMTCQFEDPREVAPLVVRWGKILGTKEYLKTAIGCWGGCAAGGGKGKNDICGRNFEGRNAKN